MDNRQCKQLPGWEEFQPKAKREAQAQQEMGMYDPAKWNPSGQEVSLRDRLASKLDKNQEAEYGEPMQQMMFAPVAVPSRKRRK